MKRPTSAGLDDRPWLPARRPRFWIRPALVFILCALVLNGLLGEQGLLERVHARREFKAALHELRQLRAENARLRERIQHLRHDPRTLEALARRDLGLVRKGEILVILKDVPRADGFDRTPGRALQ